MLSEKKLTGCKHTSRAQEIFYCPYKNRNKSVSNCHTKYGDMIYDRPPSQPEEPPKPLLLRPSSHKSVSSFTKEQNSFWWIHFQRRFDYRRRLFALASAERKFSLTIICFGCNKIFFSRIRFDDVVPRSMLHVFIQSHRNEGRATCTDYVYMCLIQVNCAIKHFCCIDPQIG